MIGSHKCANVVLTGDVALLPEASAQGCQFNLRPQMFLGRVQNLTSCMTLMKNPVRPKRSTSLKQTHTQQTRTHFLDAYKKNSFGSTKREKFSRTFLRQQQLPKLNGLRTTLRKRCK